MHTKTQIVPIQSFQRNGKSNINVLLNIASQKRTSPNNVDLPPFIKQGGINKLNADIKRWRAAKV